MSKKPQPAASPQAVGCAPRAIWAAQQNHSELQPMNNNPQQAIAATLQKAMAAHGQGQLDQAEALYRAILQAQPRHFDALHWLGVIALQRGQAQAAEQLIGQALTIDPNQPAAHSNRGNALLSLQQPEAALACYDRALALLPEFADALINRGNALRQLQRYAEALDSYERALALNPRSAEALNNLGNTLLELKRPQEALGSLAQALALKPNYVDALYNHGNALLDLKRPEEALASYERVLALRPNHAKALCNRGSALRELKQPEAALASLERALQLQPDYPDALLNRGNVLLDLKRSEEALASYDRLLALQPDLADAFCRRGNALLALKRSQEALACYDHALALNPDCRDALNNRGQALLKLERAEEALAGFDRLLELRPDAVETLNNRGNVLLHLKQAEPALANFERALALQPGDTEALCNRGNALRELRQPEQALGSYEQALAADPQLAKAYCYRGNALQDLRHLDEACTSYQRALALQPDYGEARLNLALTQLLLGRFGSGWPLYEARYQADNDNRQVVPPELPFPPWQGQALAGKTLLVYQEQGLGDTLQFCRYLPLLKQQGAARITLVCAKPLHAALGSLAGVDALRTPAEAQAAPPPHDYWALLMSLPLHRGTRLDNIPAAVPYLAAPQSERAAVAETLRTVDGLKIGVCWQGSAAYQGNAERSSGLAPFQRLFALPGARFFSLLPDSRGEFLAAAGAAAVDLGHEIDAHSAPFAETMALLEQLDLVITVDTSIAHLAGALGRPTWILLPYLADWRWLLERQDSPWYPSARLFRQARRGDWDAVFHQVEQALRQRLS